MPPAPGSTPIISYNSSTASQVPLAANLSQGELAINVTDKKLYSKDSGGNVILIASNGGDVTGPATSTNLAIPTFSGTTGKLLLNNSGVTISAGVVTGTGFTGAFNGSLGATTPSTVVATTISTSGNISITNASALSGINISATDTTKSSYVALQSNGATGYVWREGTTPVLGGNSGDLLFYNGGVTGLKVSSTGVVTAPSGLSITGDLTTTGNTILGNASTDTLNVGNGDLVKDASGNVGIGRTSGATAIKLDIGSTYLSQSTLGINTSTKSVRISSPEAGVLFTTDINTAGGASGTQTSSAQIGYVYFNSTFPTDFVIGTGAQTVASNLRFYNNNSEVMSIDSNGISTLNGSASRLVIQPSTATNNAFTRYINTGGTAYVGLDSSVGSVAVAYSLNMWHAGAYPIVFATSNTERMRIDSSGNVLVGITASGWNGFVAPVIEFAGGCSVEGSAAGSIISFSNTNFNTGSYVYKLPSVGSSYYQQYNSSHIWAIAPSGTPGTAITWTTAMTLDASGNLGLGLTPNASSSDKLIQFGSATYMGELGNGDSSGVTHLGCNVKGGSSSTPKYYATGQVAAMYSIGGSGGHQWFNAPSGTAGTAITFTPAMTLDNSGNLGIGRSPTSAFDLYRASGTTLNNLTVGDTSQATFKASNSRDYIQIGVDNANGFIDAGTVSPLVFYTGGSIKMRLDASGNLGIGLTPTGLDLLELAAGTTTKAPLGLTSGSLLTSVDAGSVEYDGVDLYFTGNTTSGRGYVPSTQIFRLTANGTAIGAAIANFFGANSAINLAAGGVYEIEAYCYFTKTTAGTVTVTATTSLAPVNLSGSVQYGAIVGGTATGAANQISLFNSTAAAAAFGASGSLTTAVNHLFIVKLLVEANASASNLRINFTESAGTVTPLRTSYYKVTRLPAGNQGSFAA